ncbi:Glycolipid transfer protein [Anabarilius grahami]|uniref:Glycolipid transfer protein n=1 Tax=Anabarilius grahami TaxID=495550 RepID=A0A3N0XGZ4_ANAGA|nr:Glycolipid transfer protein [Anabarilius grahami]
MALLMEHQFRQLSADKQVETRPFLEAVSHLPPFFDCLGSAVFSPIKADIVGNITKIKAVYDSNPTRYKTLQHILEAEKEMHGSEWPKYEAEQDRVLWELNEAAGAIVQHTPHEQRDFYYDTVGGAASAFPVMSMRGLRFIQVMLQSLVDGDKDENNPNHIRVNITKAYEMALKKYHGWFVQKLFKAALYAAPYRSDFLKALSKGREVKDEECLDKVRQFLVNFTATIDAIYEMYTKMNAELDYTV